MAEITLEYGTIFTVAGALESGNGIFELRTMPGSWCLSCVPASLPAAAFFGFDCFSHPEYGGSFSLQVSVCRSRLSCWDKENWFHWYGKVFSVAGTFDALPAYSRVESRQIRRFLYGSGVVGRAGVRILHRTGRLRL